MMAMRRQPRGYVGQGHETIGSDILSVVQVLKLPEQVLGPDECRRLKEIDPNGWYPIGWLLDLMDQLDKAVGHYGLLRMGRKLFEISHKERVLKVATSARDIVEGIDGMYHHANRGAGIGGWKVLSFGAATAELEKTTPHHCVMEQGILSAALAAVRCPGLVSQRECLRRGSDLCIYTITSSLSDERWYGKKR